MQITKQSAELVGLMMPTSIGTPESLSRAHRVRGDKPMTAKKKTRRDENSGEVTVNRIQQNRSPKHGEDPPVAVVGLREKLDDPMLIHRLTTRECVRLAERLLRIATGAGGWL